MLRCEILDVHGFDPAIHGMRNPKNSWDKSDSVFCPNECSCDSCSRCEKHECYVSNITIGENDLKLMKTLFNAGTEHRKYDRMIQVWMDIEANHTFWSEFDTYKIGTVRNSCSKMHKIHVKEFVADDFDHEGIYEVGGHTKEHFEETVKELEWLRQKFNETHEKKYWRAIIEILPMGFRIKATVMMNYEVIARIIEQRSHHKLDEWHQLVDVLSGLPYIQDLIE